MKRVFTASNQFDIYIIKDLLESREIACLVRGELLQGAIGELPAQLFPELWIMDNSDEAAAKNIIQHYAKSLESQAKDNWRCDNCNEMHPDSFTQCWSCGKDRPCQAD